MNEKKNKILVLSSSVKCILTAITTAEQVLNCALEGTYLNITVVWHIPVYLVYKRMSFKSKSELHILKIGSKICLPNRILNVK